MVRGKSENNLKVKKITCYLKLHLLLCLLQFIPVKIHIAGLQLSATVAPNIAFVFNHGRLDFHPFKAEANHELMCEFRARLEMP